MEPVPERSPQPILGLDNVRLELPIAGVGSRVAAALLDYLLLAGLALVWWMAGMLLVAWLDQLTWVWVIVGFGTFALQWGYFAVLEIAMGGQTPGKAILGLRAVARTGGRAGGLALIVRSLLRTVDVLVAVPMMLVDPHARRLGDRLAGTLVVYVPASPLGELHIERLPHGWQAREVALVEGLVRRAPEMEPERVQALAARLLALIGRDDPTLATQIMDVDDRLLALIDVLQARKA